jgi:predicted amidohydrolase
MKLTIALAQINTLLRNVLVNLERYLSLIQEARASGADLRMG